MLEKEFYQEVKSRLQKDGFDCVRIESGSTEKGIPDIFVQGNGGDFWVEMKAENAKVLDTKKEKIKVHYRSGQLAWAMRYALAHHGKKHTYTLIHCTDSVIIIDMTRENIAIIEDNFVPTERCEIISLDCWTSYPLGQRLSHNF